MLTGCQATDATSSLHPSTLGQQLRGFLMPSKEIIWVIRHQHGYP
jgi:hypothetical protein